MDREGGGTVQPLAIVFTCRLLAATVLNMLVIPALHLRFGDVKARIARLAGGAPTG